MTTRAVIPFLVIAAVAGRLALAALFCLFFAASYPIAMLGDAAGCLFREVRS